MVVFRYIYIYNLILIYIFYGIYSDMNFYYFIDNMDMDKNQTDTTDTAAIRTIDIFI
jgi:hypothetical protein